MQLQQLDYVLAVVDEGSFTAAARSREVSQPSLSQGVRALESELGAELFHRAGRRVRLTAAGEAFVDPARRAVRDAATARAAVAQVTGLAAGRLDLVCLPSFAADPVAVLVGRFRRAHPGVTVRLAEPEDPVALVEEVRTGASELGFAELPTADDLVAIPLEDHDYVAVLPPGDAGLAGGAAGPVGVAPAPLPLRALAAEPLVTTPPGTSTRRLVDEALAAAGIAPTIAVESDHREAIAPLVVAGAGVALLPRRLAASARALGAVVREITPPIVRRVGLVHRPGPLSPAARAFLAVAAPGAPRPASRPPVRRRRAGRAPTP
jgi:LysR family transcriptional regulator, carnitine catabolism transcriptional activator